MKPHHPEHSEELLTNRVRTVHEAPVATRADELADAERRSRANVLDRLHEAGAGRTRAPRRRTLQLVAAAACIAVGLTIALAVAPDGKRNGATRAGSVPGLPSSASAAEALEWAGDVLVQSGGAAGSGPAWHGVSRAYADGELTTVTEQWFDPSRATYVAAAWGDAQTKEDTREILQVTSIDADDTSRFRTYEKPPGAQGWQLPVETPSPHVVQELPRGYGAGQRVLSEAVQQWLEATGGSASRQQLIAATERFSSLTQDAYFGGQAPEMPAPEIGPDGQPMTRTLTAEQSQSGADALRIRPMLYLLTSVQATPQATQALYAQIGHFETLERLPNVTIGGKQAIRIRFDANDFGTHRERVLVLDATTGAPLRTESVDRSSWTEIARARRVQQVGVDSVLCSEKLVPCDLVAGDGPLADQWNTYITSERGRRETEFMKDPMNAFSTVVGLRDNDAGDSAYGSYSGECSRDSRTLATCRG